MKKQTKKAPAKAKAPARKPTQLDRIEARLKGMEERIHASITERGPLLENIQRDLCAVRERIDAQRMEGYALAQAKVDREQHTPKPQGLQPGDYTDASKETADALTAMGLETLSRNTYQQAGGRYWWDGYRIANTSSYGQTYLTPSDFLARAAVTAKELGLEPEKAEAWVPKVGDWVVVGPVVKGRTGSAVDWPKHPLKVTDVTTSLGDLVCYLDEPGRRAIACDRVRPATDAEITAHLAKLEAAKPVTFGTWVDYRGKNCRTIADNADHLGVYPLYSNADRIVFRAKRSEFTVLDPQP